MRYVRLGILLSLCVSSAVMAKPIIRVVNKTNDGGSLIINAETSDGQKSSDVVVNPQGQKGDSQDIDMGANSNISKVMVIDGSKERLLEMPVGGVAPDYFEIHAYDDKILISESLRVFPGDQYKDDSDWTSLEWE